MNEMLIKIIVAALLIAFFIVRSRFTSHYKKFGFRQAVKYIVIAGLMIPYIMGYFEFAHFFLPGYIRILGCVVIAAGLALFFSAHYYLGKNWIPIIEKQINKSKILIREGPYNYIRHPIYTASLIVLAGLLIFSCNWLLAGGILAFLLALYIYKIGKEEAELIRIFGKKYKDYMKTTGRFLPKLSLHKFIN